MSGAADPSAAADLAQLVAPAGHRRASSSAVDAAAAGASVVSVPSPDSLTHAIAQRYRLDLAATYAGHANLIAVNPLEPKADMSEASKSEYEDRAYRLRPGTAAAGNVDVSPHAYDLACRVYWAARRTGHSQSIVYRYAPSPPLDRHSLRPYRAVRGLGG